MKRPLVIEYEDAAGSETTRVLEDYEYRSEPHVPGVHYLEGLEIGSGRWKSFRVDRIISAAFTDTGEAVAPWKVDNPDGTVPARVVLRPYFAAIHRMRAYVARTRGFRQREKDRFADFVLDLVADKRGLPDALVAEAAFRLATEDQGGAVPLHQLDCCRRHALIIAKGSGRRPLTDEDAALIYQTFPPKGKSTVD
ncbi:hypothetical protein [uncultured Luteimonas sp.]|uniref:hypothetical protein n=1 Tax=uncultured Luteimonas sp. TaxID=453144 RepID=UPI002612EB57|nr:hypothetical protein [uncultured Luteimonas sp.]